MASSPQPVPISSSRVPSPTPAASSSRSILRACASASGSVAASPPGGMATRCPSCGRDRGVEQGRGVAQRLVEERREQVVRQVVVVGDVLRVLVVRAALRARRAGDHQGAQPSAGTRGPGWPGRRRARSGSRPGPGVPGAGEVGLAEADEAVPARAGRRTRRAGARSWRDRPGRSTWLRPGPSSRWTVTGSRCTAAVKRRRATTARDRGARTRRGRVEAGPGRVPAGATDSIGHEDTPACWWVGRGWTRQAARPEPDAVAFGSGARSGCLRAAVRTPHRGRIGAAARRPARR